MLKRNRYLFRCVLSPSLFLLHVRLGNCHPALHAGTRPWQALCARGTPGGTPARPPSGSAPARAVRARGQQVAQTPLPRAAPLPLRAPPDGPHGPGRAAGAPPSARGGSGVRGPGSGVGVWGPGGGLAGGEQRPGSASGGAPSAGRPRTRRPDVAPRSPPVGWAGAGWGDAGLGAGWLGGDGPDQVGVGLGRTGAGTGVCWSRAGLSWPWVGWDSGESLAGAGPGIPCLAPITDQGSRIGSFSIFLLLLII